MNKIPYTIAILIIFIGGTLSAEDYQWDLINSLIKGDLQKTESIIHKNANTMTAFEKRNVINFTLTYSRGENTTKVLASLQKYNIRPTNFDLYSAINKNQPDNVIQFLLNSGLEANGEILLLTMEKQRFILAHQFIESGIDVNYQYPLTKSYADGMTPLLYAVKWDNFDLVKLLLEHGANINARAKNGSTALSMAHANGNIPMHNYLIEHGAVNTEGNITQPAQSTGILSIIDNQIVIFQTGTYRAQGGIMDIRFSGNNITGTINYTRNGRTNIGAYHVQGNTMTLLMENRTFIYNLDSAVSFSGNGEVWVRVGG